MPTWVAEAQFERTLHPADIPAPVLHGDSEGALLRIACRGPLAASVCAVWLLS